MFKRVKPTPAQEPFTYVHRDTIIEGKVTATGRVRVHGTVNGDVSVKGVLEVAESGVVACDTLVADEVKIIGRVTVGLLEASGKVEIWRGGELVGDVRAAALDIEDGAIFTGRSDMTSQPPSGPHSSASSEVAEQRSAATSDEAASMALEP